MQLLFLTFPSWSEASHFLFFPVPLSSRQRYVLGDSAMHQMAQSSVFLSGMGGVGIEIGGLNISLWHNSTVMLSVFVLTGSALPTLTNLTSCFTAKNIVLAGVKVCTLAKSHHCHSVWSFNVECLVCCCSLRNYIWILHAMPQDVGTSKHAFMQV